MTEMVDIGQVDTLLAIGAQPILPSTAASTGPLASLGLSVDRPDAFLDVLTSELTAPDETDAPAGDSTLSVSAKDQEEISSAAAQLEALMLEMLLKQMWETIPKSELFGQGLDSKFYREMWIEELSKDLAESGPGIGLKAMLEQELTYTVEQSIDPAGLTI